MEPRQRPRVVIVGAGFGGLWAARHFAGKQVDVTLIDKNNYHTFLALLYQVAAAELEAEDIAYPIRSIFSKTPNVGFLLAEVKTVDFQNKAVLADIGSVPYDFLILATGSVTHTFGIPGVANFAFPLKTLEDAVSLKNHIICCFEKAERIPDHLERQSLLTFVIVGGGATGVEYAGALNELIRGPLARDYSLVDFREVRTILLEASDRLVTHMPEPIRNYTRRRLTHMGIEIRFGVKVREVSPQGVRVEGGQEIPSRTVVWTTGVRGEEVGLLSGLSSQADGRVPVLPTLQVRDHPEVYIVGDLADISERGQHLPMVAQVAIQSGLAAAANVVRQINGEPPLPFRYHDRGMMITIGRNAAGAAIGKKAYTGFLAWLLWLIIHLFNLIGFRNRIMVFINWAWDYLLYERAVRFVFPVEGEFRKSSSACGPDRRPNVRLE